MRWPLFTLLFVLATGFFRPEASPAPRTAKGPASSTVQTTPLPVRSWGDRRMTAASSDTVKATVRAGRTLIVGLPDSLIARPVVAYRIVRAPAMSWLVDRSFLWRTVPGDTGHYAFRLTARLTGELDVPLVVQVDVF